MAVRRQLGLCDFAIALRFVCLTFLLQGFISQSCVMLF